MYAQLRNREGVFIGPVTSDITNESNGIKAEFPPVSETLNIRGCEIVFFDVDEYNERVIIMNASISGERNLVSGDRIRIDGIVFD